jgi:hypothetical protein
MAKESESICPNLYGTNAIVKPRQILPRGRVAVILSTMVFVLVISNNYPETTQIFYGTPEPTHTSHQTAVTGMLLAFYVISIILFVSCNTANINIFL